MKRIYFLLILTKGSLISRKQKLSTLHYINYNVLILSVMKLKIQPSPDYLYPQVHSSVTHCIEGFLFLNDFIKIGVSFEDLGYLC